MALSPATKARKMANRVAQKLEKNEAVRRKKEENAKSKGKVWNPATKRWVSEATLKKHQQKFEFKPYVKSTLATPAFLRKPRINSATKSRVRFQTNNKGVIVPHVQHVNNNYLTYKTPTESRLYAGRQEHMRKNGTPDLRVSELRAMRRALRIPKSVNTTAPGYFSAKYTQSLMRLQKNVKSIQTDLKKAEEKRNLATKNISKTKNKLLSTAPGRRDPLERYLSKIIEYKVKKDDEINNLKTRLNMAINKERSQYKMGTGL